DNDYYNDGERYLTIKIVDLKRINVYTIQITEDSKSSIIDLVYAYNHKGEGGSGENFIDLQLKRKLLKDFDREFILPIQRKLNENAKVDN
nr:hypothetical protein [Nitrosopumilus sp.]